MNLFLRIMQEWGTYYNEHIAVRRGQALFNVLPDAIAAKIGQSENDPFHDDTLIPACLDEVYRLCIGA